MEGEDQQRRPALETWQAIADYLGVSKRTAQNYERLQNLPVYRLDGDKARVWAYAEELDGWRERFRQMLPEGFAVDGSPVAGEREVSEYSAAAEGSLPPNGGAAAQIASTGVAVAGMVPLDSLAVKGGTMRRHWLRYAATIAGGLGVGVAAVKMASLFHDHQPPTAYRVEGATLIVLGRGGSELWRFTFPKQMPDYAYRIRPDQYCSFVDLEGDGLFATLFSYAPVDVTAERSLVCFNSDGTIRWKFLAGKEVRDNLGRRFPPPYLSVSFAAVRSPNSNRAQVVVASVHNWSFPTQIAVLDGKTGKVASEYWHRGHLTELAIVDLDHDGHPEILLGGVNDAVGYKCATMVIFDHRQVSGSARDALGQPYFQGMPAGTEKWTLYFPKTPISKQEEFNRVNQVLVRPDRIRIIVGEGVIQLNSLFVMYELDYSLRPISAVLSVNLVGRFLEMQDAGKLPKESAYAIADRLMEQIKVIKGGGS